MQGPAPEVHLSIASRFENIELVKIVLDDVLESMGVAEDARHWVELSVREAVANAIKHGNRQDPEKKVEVGVGLNDGELVISVADHGVGFDPGKVRDPLAPENRFARDGRGIFYMRKFMDSVDYSFRPDGGTILTLRKRLGPDGTAEAGTDRTAGEEDDMKVTMRERDGVAILDLAGKFTIGSGDAAIREAIQQCAQDGKIKILLNTVGVTTIDSSGIGELVAGFTSVANKGGSMKLVNLPPKLQDILSVTQLITVFETFEDEDEAVRSFA